MASETFRVQWCGLPSPEVRFGMDELSAALAAAGLPAEEGKSGFNIQLNLSGEFRTGGVND